MKEKRKYMAEEFERYMVNKFKSSIYWKDPHPDIFIRYLTDPHHYYSLRIWDAFDLELVNFYTPFIFNGSLVKIALYQPVVGYFQELRY